MFEFLCRFRIHEFSGWSQYQEVPLWRHDMEYAIGYQPTERKLYSGRNGGLIESVVVDLNFKLVGKAIEQRRACKRCYLVETRMQRSCV